MKKLFSIILVLAILSLVLITGCQSNDVNEEPENLWEEIQERGVLIVGTSADYPPHEFINEEGEFDGWDMDLIREIADRLDLEVEIRDLGFDALIASIQGNKVDVAIAGMAATPERKEKVDFSMEFFWGEKAFLARTDSDIELEDENSIKDYTVGVQAGSTLDTWITEDLIDTGMMEESQVTRYERAEQIALDVKSGRIEIGFIDAPVANELVESVDEIEIILTGRFANEEGGAIAMPKGETELKEKLDEVIQELKDEGYIEELNIKWF